MTTVDTGIFKAYDVRGIYPDQLGEDIAYRVGRAFARVIADMEGAQPSELTLAVGRDMRLTAPAMAARYIDGIRDEGAAVLDVGRVGTEMLYFTVGSRDLPGGLMCTASHNPKAYTGAKLVRSGAVPLSGERGIAEIRDLLEQGLGEPPGGGTLEEISLYDEFYEALMAFIDPAAIKPLRVVVDGGNGMAGPMVGPVLERLGLDLVTAYWRPDGNFPDHEPNPLLPENRQFIMEEVVRRGADLGIAWDGDGDRCFFIDDTGAFVDGDFLTALLAGSMLRKQPGATVLYDVRASRAVADTVSSRGGRALINRVGHAFFKARMRSENAAFGGEVSGHYYFRDFYCADSGSIPALLILELVSLDGSTLSQLLEPYRSQYFISGEINSEVEDQQGKLEELSARYSDGEQQRLDGLSVDYDDWHFNVRPSNTEPLLRLCLESVRSHEDMERRRDEVLALIRS
jgi:phosphomannomutase